MQNDKIIYWVGGGSSFKRGLGMGGVRKHPATSAIELVNAQLGMTEMVASQNS